MLRRLPVGDPAHHRHTPRVSASVQPPDAGDVTEEISERLGPEARWGRTISVTVARSSRRSISITVVTMSAGWLGFCSILFAVAYPAWRTVAFLCVGLAYAAPFAFARVRRRVWPRWAMDDLFALSVFLLGSFLTGGIYSPVIASALGPVNQLVQLRGRARPALLRVCAFSVGLVILAVLPRAWVGPRVPDPFFAAGILLFLVPSLLIQAQLSRLAARMLDSMIHQVARAREQVASQSLTRARELELLSSKLTHELKNPLGAAKALIQVSARTTPDAETREQLSVVEGEVGRIHSILEEYLSFSRPVSSLERRPLQLGAVVEGVLAAAKRRADAAGVFLERHGDAQVSADARRLTEALLHLVANAIDATPAQGQVRVEIAQHADRIEIAVRDTGAGMPPDVLARVGTPFFTTRAKGTGLGVLLSRNVFVQHGGSLVLHSAPGRGTTAIASLPVSGKAPESVPAAGG